MNVSAFGVSMSLGRFVAEVGWPLLFFPMWPLWVLASLAQYLVLRRSGVFDDRRAWKVGFAVLLSPVLAMFVRTVFYFFGVPEANPFERQAFTSVYVLTVGSGSILSTCIAYGIATLLTTRGVRK